MWGLSIWGANLAIQDQTAVRAGAVRALLWLKKAEGNRCITFVSYGGYSDFLDVCGAYGTVRDYYDFRDDVKNIGTQKHMTPRQVEMALWKFDEMKGEQ